MKDRIKNKLKAILHKILDLLAAKIAARYSSNNLFKKELTDRLDQIEANLSLIAVRIEELHRDSGKND